MHGITIPLCFHIICIRRRKNLACKCEGYPNSAISCDHVKTEEDKCLDMSKVYTHTVNRLSLRVEGRDGMGEMNDSV